MLKVIVGNQVSLVSLRLSLLIQETSIKDLNITSTRDHWNSNWCFFWCPQLEERIDRLSTKLEKQKPIMLLHRERIQHLQTVLTDLNVFTTLEEIVLTQSKSDDTCWSFGTTGSSAWITFHITAWSERETCSLVGLLACFNICTSSALVRIKSFLKCISVKYPVNKSPKTH